MKIASAIELWEEFKGQNPELQDDYSVWAFGSSPEMADELLALVLEGKKTATASSHLMYDENEIMPFAGAYSVVLDGQAEAQAIIKTISVEVLPFNEVTEEFAYLEGEGDRSLEYWQEVHESFFRQEFEGTDFEFDEYMPVVCEIFELIYQK